ncbi:MAG: calcium-binding protein, partial [Hyphomicrobium sp.]
TLAEIRDRLLVGTAGDDVFVGFDDRDDVLDGQGGSDALVGGGGNDTYKFGIGSSDVSVSDTAGVDKIVFGAGIGAAGVRFSDEGGDLLVRLVGHGDTLIILGGASRTSSERHVETFEFADGAVLTMAEVKRSLVLTQSTPWDDIVDARAGIVVDLPAGLGDDLVLADNGTTLVFRLGDGADIFDGTTKGGASRIVIADFVSTDVILRRVDLDGPDVLIAFAGATDQLLVRGALGNSNLSSIRFADGVEWTRADLASAAVAAQASTRSDIITGSSRNDAITGGLGDDDIDGGAGDDVYHFSRGDGRDIIDDASGGDRLEIRGLTPDEVTVTRPVADRNELLLTFAGTGDEILLKVGSTTTSGRGVEFVAFGDGTQWTRAVLDEKALGLGTPFDDVLTGNSAANTITGGTGSDLLIGAGGADTYVYARGDGRDIIDDRGSSSELNILRIRDYVPGDVTVVRHDDRPNDLILRFTSEDEIAVINGFIDYLSGIRSFVFENGVVWTHADVLAQIERQVSSEGDDRLGGTSAVDSLIGLGGDDVLDSGAGADTLHGGRGSDYLVGGDNGDTYIFERGDGADTIKDTGYLGIDRIVIRGYAPRRGLAVADDRRQGPGTRFR